jgi:hypothetical protein
MVWEGDLRGVGHFFLLRQKRKRKDWLSVGQECPQFDYFKRGRLYFDSAQQIPSKHLDLNQSVFLTNINIRACRTADICMIQHINYTKKRHENYIKFRK